MVKVKTDTIPCLLAHSMEGSTHQNLQKLTTIRSVSWTIELTFQLISPQGTHPTTQYVIRVGLFRIIRKSLNTFLTVYCQGIEWFNKVHLL